MKLIEWKFLTATNWMKYSEWKLSSRPLVLFLYSNDNQENSHIGACFLNRLLTSYFTLSFSHPHDAALKHHREHNYLMYSRPLHIHAS